MSTGNLTIGIGKYCLQLEEPITIKLNDPYFANSSKIYECSVLYFYDDTELIDSTEKSYYLTDDDIGKKCSIFARIEDYRDGGDLYFLYPEIWFDWYYTLSFVPFVLSVIFKAYPTLRCEKV